MVYNSKGLLDTLVTIQKLTDVIPDTMNPVALEKLLRAIEETAKQAITDYTDERSNGISRPFEIASVSREDVLSRLELLAIDSMDKLTQRDLYETLQKVVSDDAMEHLADKIGDYLTEYGGYWDVIDNFIEEEGLTTNDALSAFIEKADMPQ
jgi:hypothetical protein